MLLPARLVIPAIPGGRFLPLLAKILALLGGQILEPPGPAPDFFLLLGGKAPEVLVPFADQVSFLRGKLAPPLEPFLRLFPLLGGHALPSFRPPAEAFLTLRGQLIPPLFEGP